VTAAAQMACPDFWGALFVTLRTEAEPNDWHVSREWVDEVRPTEVAMVLVRGVLRPSKERPGWYRLAWAWRS
jgi:hypothetical protein